MAKEQMYCAGTYECRMVNTTTRYMLRGYASYHYDYCRLCGNMLLLLLLIIVIIHLLP